MTKKNGEKSATEPEFLKYVGLIWKTAQSFQRSTGVDADELMSVGRTAFVAASLAWDKERGPFPPLMQRVLLNTFSHYVRRNPLVTAEGGTVRDKIVSNRPEWHPLKALMSKERIYTLSEDGRYITWLLLNVPCEVFGIDGTQPPKMIRGAIRRALRKEGWSWKRIWRVNRELKEAANGHH